MKVIFDSNIWVSYAIGNHLNDIPDLLLRPDVMLFACAELFEELNRIREYPKLQKILKPERVEATLELIHAKAVVVPLTNPEADFADPKDNYLLDLCSAVIADYLVTGDKQLLALEQYGETRIVTYSIFRDLVL